MGAAKKLDETLEERTDLTVVSDDSGDTGEKSSRIDYEVLGQDLANKVQDNFEKQLERVFDDSSQSFVHLVLNSVKDANYEKGKLAIKAFINTKKQYPHFETRTANIVEYCKDLIDSIETKRNFPNMHLLSMTKQKEIIDYVLMHFNELKHSLKALEKAGKDEHVIDLRSTHLLVKTVCFTIFIIVMSLALVNFDGEFGEPFWNTLSRHSRQFVDFAFNSLGL